MGRDEWFTKADFNLVHAWSETSHDPFVGNMQDGKTFWQTIKSISMKLRRTNEEHSISSQNTKKTIKINDTYHHFNRVQCLSWNEDTYLIETLKLYKDDMGKEFFLISIWNFIKDKPKWEL